MEDQAFIEEYRTTQDGSSRFYLWHRQLRPSSKMLGLQLIVFSIMTHIMPYAKIHRSSIFFHRETQLPCTRNTSRRQLYGVSMFPLVLSLLLYMGWWCMSCLIPVTDKKLWSYTISHLWFCRNMYAYADFSGLWRQQHSTMCECILPRTGYIINCPFHWVSKLGTVHALSTTEREYTTRNMATTDFSTKASSCQEMHYNGIVQPPLDLPFNTKINK